MPTAEFGPWEPGIKPEIQRQRILHWRACAYFHDRGREGEMFKRMTDWLTNPAAGPPALDAFNRLGTISRRKIMFAAHELSKP